LKNIVPRSPEGRVKAKRLSFNAVPDRQSKIGFVNRGRALQSVEMLPEQTESICLIEKSSRSYSPRHRPAEWI
jgi:hypothetical protein